MWEASNVVIEALLSASLCGFAASCTCVGLFPCTVKGFDFRSEGRARCARRFLRELGGRVSGLGQLELARRRLRCVAQGYQFLPEIC